MAHRSAEFFSPETKDVAAYERLLAARVPAHIRYVVWFTPRSGSSWLTDIARQSGRLSRPAECFNPNFMPTMAHKLHAATMEQYIQMLLLQRNTDGVFGCELTWYHLRRCFDDATDFLRYFDGAPSVLLIREDIVAQAVSLVKMKQTRISHSTISDAAARAAADVAFTYDAEKIAQAVYHLMIAEDGCEDLFRRYGHQPLRLSYEHNMSMGAGPVLNAIAHHIGVRPIDAGALESGHQKVGTDLNADFAARFRAERPDLIADLAARRAERLAAVDRTLPGRLPPKYQAGGRGKARSDPGRR